MTFRPALALLAAAAAVAAVLVLATGGWILQEPSDGGDSDGGTEESSGEGSLAGTYAEYEITYTVSSGGPFSRDSETETGTLTVAYVYYDSDRGAYYIEQYASLGDKTSSESYWTDETEDRTWSYLGTASTEDLDGSEITVYVYRTTYSSGFYTIKETHYIGDDGLAYYIEYTAVSRMGFGISSYSYEYVLSGTGEYRSEDEHTVTVYCESGISVSGAEGTYGIGDTVTLTASGSSFYGWYDSGGNLLSTETIYTFTMAVSDVIILAEDSVTPDATVDADDTISFSSYSGYASGTYHVMDSSGNTEEADGASYAFPALGDYTVLYEDGDVRWMMTVHVTDTVEKTYTWVYGGGTYSYVLSIDYDDYVYYVGYYDVDERGDTYSTTGSSAGDLAFVYTDDVDDAYLQEIADYIDSITQGWSQQEKANMLLAFVEYIEYAYDSDTHGTDEYWNTPLETLWLQCGDCEDTSILFCAIAREMGLDTCLILMNGHMAVGVYLESFTAPSVSGSSFNSSIYGFEIGGKTYYYGETTGEGWLVGQVPSSVGEGRNAYSNYFIAAMSVTVPA